MEMLAVVAVASSKLLDSSIALVCKKKKLSSIQCTPPKAAVSL